MAKYHVELLLYFLYKKETDKLTNQSHAHLRLSEYKYPMIKKSDKQAAKDLTKNPNGIYDKKLHVVKNFYKIRKKHLTLPNGKITI
jgi:hypothetical protein